MTGVQAFFLPVGTSQRYCVYHPPQGRVRHLVLYIHPFAEEINKTRRMAALQARSLAAAGDAVLQMDLLGCGDSAGDFAEARWDAWLDDLQAAARWLQQQHAQGGSLWLWGLRAGCLLAADAARRMDTPCHLLFWQPSFADGSLQLQQFLRLRLAADMIAQPDPQARQTRGAMDALRQQLQAGEPLEIAGYTLSPRLADGLQHSRLLPAPSPGPVARRLVWLELASSATATLSPLGSRTLEQWRVAGWQVQGTAATGPAFWQSTEIEEAPALIDATLDALATEPTA